MQKEFQVSEEAVTTCNSTEGQQPWKDSKGNCRVHQVEGLADHNEGRADEERGR